MDEVRMFGQPSTDSISASYRSGVDQSGAEILTGLLRSDACSHYATKKERLVSMALAKQAARPVRAGWRGISSLIERVGTMGSYPTSRRFLASALRRAKPCGRHGPRSVQCARNIRLLVG